MNILRTRRFNLVSLTVASALVMACGQSSKTGDDHDHDHDHDHEHQATVVSQANELVRAQSDVERYKVDLSHDSHIDVRLEDTHGDPLGSIRIVNMPGRTVIANLVTKDGVEVAYHAHYTERPDEGTDSRIRLEQDGEALDLTMTRNAAGEVIDSTYALAGPRTPQVDLPSGATGADRLVVLRDGALLSTPEIQAWLDKAPVRRVLDSTAAKVMYLVMGDRGLVQGIAGAAELAESLPHEHAVSGHAHGDDHAHGDGEVASSWRGIHKSPLCSSLITALTAAGLSAAVCGSCVATLGATPVTGGVSGVLAIPACAWCAGIVGLSIADLVACSIAYFTRTTLSDCQDECKSWDDPAVTADEHGCTCTCNPGKCEAAVRQAIAAQGATYCSTNQCLNNECKGYYQKCGNGILENAFGCNEQCEKDSDCGANQECVACQCKPKCKERKPGGGDDSTGGRETGGTTGGDKLGTVDSTSLLPYCDEMVALPH